MANITFHPHRSASAVLTALDAALERLEGFLRGFADHPVDLRHALHAAQIRHLACCGNRGQAII